MSGGVRVPLPITVAIPLRALRRIGDLACMIRRRSEGEVNELAAEIEKIVDEHADPSVVQLDEIRRLGT